MFGYKPEEYFDIPKKRIQKITTKCQIAASKGIMKIVKGFSNRKLTYLDKIAIVDELLLTIIIIDNL